jgi:hypothetical protein
MCLGVFDANASADHVTFPRELGTIKPLGLQCFHEKNSTFLPTRLGEEAKYFSFILTIKACKSLPYVFCTLSNTTSPKIPCAHWKDKGLGKTGCSCFLTTPLQAPILAS